MSILDIKKHRMLLEFAEFKPTPAWMSNTFNELNRQCFNNELPQTCVLKISKLNKKYLGNFAPRANTNLYTTNTGQLIYKEKVTVDNHTAEFPFPIDKDWISQNCQPTITLNNIYAMNEKEWTSVLLHEMCHYSTFIKGFMDSSKENDGHGILFRRECEEAARRMGNGWSAEFIETSEQLKEVIDNDAAAAEAARISNGYIVIVVYNQSNGHQVILGYLTKEWSLVQELYAFSIKDDSMIGIAYLDDKLLYAKLTLRYKTSRNAFNGRKFNASFNSLMEDAAPIIEEVRTSPDLKIIIDREHNIDTHIDTGNKIKKGPVSYAIVIEDTAGTVYLQLCMKSDFDKLITQLESFTDTDNLTHIKVYEDQDLAYTLINDGYKRARDAYGSRYNITKNTRLLKQLDVYKFTDRLEK